LLSDQLWEANTEYQHQRILWKCFY
jgi:hypothetical protein